MKKLITVLALTLSAFAFADSQNPALYASWQSEIANTGQVHIVFTLKFAQDAMTATTTCSANDQIVNVSVSGDYSATMDAITVTSTAEKSDSVNGLNCNVSIKPASLSYKIEGDSLTLFQGGQSLVFSRVH